MPQPPVITGGAVAGSTRVFGRGAPNVPSPQIQICSAGANRIPEGCGGDDELLGVGGTDAVGSFGNSLGIGLSRPLVQGEIIFAVDLQHNLTGNSVTVLPAAAVPTLDVWGAAALGAALLCAVALRVRRLSPRKLSQ